MAGSLEGPIAKLARAEAQCRILQAEIHADWPPGKAWPVRTEVHRDGLEYRFYLGDLPPIKPDWGLLAGEILFNLRSALDHLVWELHVRHYRRRPIPEKIEFASQFPIFDTYQKWREKGLWRVKELGKRERRAIRFLQPYQPRRDAWRLVRNDLALLNTLHNIDKHRQLHVVVAAHHAAVMMSNHYTPEFGFRQLPSWGVLKPDRQVETWTFTKMPANIQPHHGALLEIHLSTGHAEWSAGPLLGGLWSSVALVIRRFRGWFPPVTLPADSDLAQPGWWESPNPRLRHGPYLVGIP